jgi:hypothetical protein
MFGFGCKDCSHCTRPAMIGLILLPFRIAYLLAFSWNIGLLIRSTTKICPQCGHPMRQHRR